MIVGLEPGSWFVGFAAGVTASLPDENVGLRTIFRFTARPGPTEMAVFPAVRRDSQANFQVAHALLCGFVRYSDLRGDGSRADTIESIVTTSLDAILAYRRSFEGQPVIQYSSLRPDWPNGVDTTCAAHYQGMQFNGDGVPDDTTAFGGKDLNGLFVGVLGWAFDKTGDSTYWYMADSLTGAMLDMTSWYGYSGKAYNQSFWQSQRALYWLNGGP